jgi:hypothetical protein
MVVVKVKHLVDVIQSVLGVFQQRVIKLVETNVLISLEYVIETEENSNNYMRVRVCHVQ